MTTSLKGRDESGVRVDSFAARRPPKEVVADTAMQNDACFDDVAVAVVAADEEVDVVAERLHFPSRETPLDEAAFEKRSPASGTRKQRPPTSLRPFSRPWPLSRLILPFCVFARVGLVQRKVLRKARRGQGNSRRRNFAL